MKPEPNALTDLVAFLTKPDWLTPVYWILVIASCFIAFRALRRNPDQHIGYSVARWVLHVVMGTMWWQGSLWKVPPDFGGLKYFMQEIVDHAAIPLQASLFQNSCIAEYRGVWLAGLSDGGADRGVADPWSC